MGEEVPEERRMSVSTDETIYDPQFVRFTPR
jgi:hypothetical protein